MGLILCFRSNSEDEGRFISRKAIPYYINCINFKTLDGGKESINLISLDNLFFSNRALVCRKH